VFCRFAVSQKPQLSHQWRWGVSFGLRLGFTQGRDGKLAGSIDVQLHTTPLVLPSGWRGGMPHDSSWPHRLGNPNYMVSPRTIEFHRANILGKWGQETPLTCCAGFSPAEFNCIKHVGPATLNCHMLVILIRLSSGMARDRRMPTVVSAQ
jgi:hypothetical protein